MTEQQIQTRVRTIAAQVAIACKAVADTSGAASAGLDPRGVWNAAAAVCDRAVLELQSIQSKELSRQLSDGFKTLKARFGS